MTIIRDGHILIDRSCLKVVETCLKRAPRRMRVVGIENIWTWRTGRGKGGRKSLPGDGGNSGRGPSRDDRSGMTEIVEKRASNRPRVVGKGNI